MLIELYQQRFSEYYYYLLIIQVVNPLFGHIGAKLTSFKVDSLTVQNMVATCFY